MVSDNNWLKWLTVVTEILRGGPSGYLTVVLSLSVGSYTCKCVVLYWAVQQDSQKSRKHWLLFCHCCWEQKCFFAPQFFYGKNFLEFTKGSSFKNYSYIPKFLKNEIFHQISQTHISLNELDYMHFHDLCDAWSIKLRLRA